MAPGELFALNDYDKTYDTVLWPEPIWIKVKNGENYYCSIAGTESASIEIPLFRPHFIKLSKTVFYEVNLTSQCSHLEM